MKYSEYLIFFSSLEILQKDILIPVVVYIRGQNQNHEMKYWEWTPTHEMRLTKAQTQTSGGLQPEDCYDRGIIFIPSLRFN